MNKELTPLENALILSYLHSDQLIKSLDVVLVEMKALNDSRVGMFQSCLEKLRGASKRAFINVEKNIENKAELEDELWELIGQNWDAVKSKQPPPKQPPKKPICCEKYMRCQDCPSSPNYINPLTNNKQ